MRTCSAALAAALLWSAGLGCTTPAPEASPTPAVATPAPKVVPAPQPAPAAKAAPATARPEIVKLIDRERTLTVRSSAEGPRYTLESPTGHVVVAGLTEGELAAKHPELLASVKAMLAVDRKVGDVLPETGPGIKETGAPGGPPAAP